MTSAQLPARRVALSMLALVLVLGCIEIRQAEAHEGPPFPLVMDQSVADYSVSIWTDPDIGDALFYIVVETPAGGPPDRAPKVSMWTEPVSGRLEPVTYEAKRQNLRNRMQFEAKPYFDQRDMWNLGFRLEPDGGEVGELVAQVESTPPGFGPWDLAIYMFPFVLLGGMWVVAMLRRLRSVRGIEYERLASRSSQKLREHTLAACSEEVRS